MIRAQVLKYLPKAREERIEEMSGEEELPEERWKIVGVLDSLRGRRSRGDDPIEYFLVTGVRSTL